jgi:hypothetical protein
MAQSCNKRMQIADDLPLVLIANAADLCRGRDHEYCYPALMMIE